MLSRCAYFSIIHDNAKPFPQWRVKWKHRCYKEYDGRDYGHHESPTGICLYAYSLVLWYHIRVSPIGVILFRCCLSVHHTSSPYIGGSLSNPVQQFPDVFGDWDFFRLYPYFLACAVPATFTAIAWLVTFLFLKEARISPTYLRHCLAEGVIRLFLTASRFAS